MTSPDSPGGGPPSGADAPATAESLAQRLGPDADRLVARYPNARSALLPLLHLVQWAEGYVTDAGIGFCARRLGLKKAEIGAVASFYTMFKRRPVGDWLLSVCTNPVCDVAGADAIYRRYLEALGGHHDDEAGITVEHAECLGICDAAPVVQVNYEMYGPLSDDEADDLLARCRADSPPPSNWSGEVPGTFREVERDLSGINDGADLQRSAEASARIAVESEVPPSDISGETDLPVTMPGVDPGGIGAPGRGRDTDERPHPREAVEPVAGDTDLDAVGDVPAEATGAQTSPHGTPIGATNLRPGETASGDRDVSPADPAVPADADADGSDDHRDDDHGNDVDTGDAEREDA